MQGKAMKGGNAASTEFVIWSDEGVVDELWRQIYKSVFISSGADAIKMVVLGGMLKEEEEAVV